MPEAQSLEDVVFLADYKVRQDAMAEIEAGRMTIRTATATPMTVRTVRNLFRKLLRAARPTKFIRSLPS